MSRTRGDYVAVAVLEARVDVACGAVVGVRQRHRGVADDLDAGVPAHRGQAPDQLAQRLAEVGSAG